MRKQSVKSDQEKMSDGERRRQAEQALNRKVGHPLGSKPIPPPSLVVGKQTGKPQPATPAKAGTLIDPLPRVEEDEKQRKKNEAKEAQAEAEEGDTE